MRMVWLDNKVVGWLRGQRVRLPMTRRGFDSHCRCNYSSFLSRDLGHTNSFLNFEAERLLDGRVINVATLPVMVSRLGWGSRFKSNPRLNAAGSLLEPARDPWNLAGCGHLASQGAAMRRPTQSHSDELRVRR